MAGSPLASLANSMLSDSPTSMQAFRSTQMSMPTDTKSGGTDQIAASPLSQQQQQATPTPAPAPMPTEQEAPPVAMRGPDPQQIMREQGAVDAATMRNSAQDTEGYNDPYNNEGDAGGGGISPPADPGEFGAVDGAQAGGGYAKGGVVKAIPDKATKRKVKKVKKFADGGAADDDIASADNPRSDSTWGARLKSGPLPSDDRPDASLVMSNPPNTDPSLLATEKEVDDRYKRPLPQYGKNPRDQAQFGHATKDAYSSTSGIRMRDDEDYTDTHRKSDNVEDRTQPDRASWWGKAKDVAGNIAGGAEYGLKAHGIWPKSDMAKGAGIDDVPGYAKGGMVEPVQHFAGGGISDYYWGHKPFRPQGGGIVGTDPSVEDNKIRIAHIQAQGQSDAANAAAYASMYHSDSAAQAQVNQARIHEDAANLRQSEGEDAALYGSGAAGRASQERMANTSTTTEMNPDGGNTVTRSTGQPPAGTTGSFPMGDPAADPRKRRRADGGMDDSSQMASSDMPPADAGPSVEAADGGPIPEVSDLAPDETQNVPTETSRGSTAAPAGPPEQVEGGPGDIAPDYIMKAGHYAKEGIYEGHRQLLPQGIGVDPNERKQKAMDHLTRKDADPYLGAALEAARQLEPDNPYWANVDKVVSAIGDKGHTEGKHDPQTGGNMLYSTIQALAQKFMGNTAHAAMHLEKGDVDKAAAYANNASDFVAGQNLLRFETNPEGITATVLDKKDGKEVLKKNLTTDQFHDAMATNFDEFLLNGPERVLNKVEKTPPEKQRRLGYNARSPGTDKAPAPMQAPPQDAAGGMEAQTRQPAPQPPSPMRGMQGGAQEGATAVPTTGIPAPGPNDLQGGGAQGATPVRTTGQPLTNQLAAPPQEGGGASPPMMPPTPQQQQQRPTGTYPLPASETGPPPFGPAQMATIPQGRGQPAQRGMIAGHGGQDREYQLAPRGVEGRTEGQKPGPARLVVGQRNATDEDRKAFSADRGIPSSLPTKSFSGTPKAEPTGDDRIVSTERAPRIIRGGKVEEVGQPPVQKRYGDLNPTQQKLYDVLGPERVLNGRTGETNWSKHLDEAATHAVGGKSDPAGTKAESTRRSDAERDYRERRKDPGEDDQGLTAKELRAKVFEEHHVADTGISTTSSDDGDQAVGKEPKVGATKNGWKDGKPARIVFTKDKRWVIQEGK